MEKRKKKILFVITKSNFGGAQRNVYELATHLPKEECEVVVAFGGTGVLKRKLEDAGVRTHTINSFLRDFSLCNDVHAFFELYSLMRTLRPDIVHLHSSKAGGIGALIARVCGVPKIIFTAHGWPFLEKRNIVWRLLVWKLSWFTALLAHTVILVSEYDLKNTHMPWVKKKCVVIHTGIGDVEFVEREEAREFLFSKKELARHESDLYLVTTAELTSNKNILTAIKAVALYNKTAEKKIFYIVIGDGELRESLTEYMVQNNLTDSVKLQGYVDDARRYLKAFDLFLLPSLKEGLPYALLEAGLAGLPTIASNVGGIPEVLGNTQGALINPRDTRSIAVALTTYATSHIITHLHTTSLYTYITTEFNLNTMLKKTYAQYQ